MTTAEKLTKVAENRQKLFDAGKQAELKALWDILQDYGNRTTYNYAFNVPYWNDETFYPQHDFKVVGIAQHMFYRIGVTNLKERLEECGVSLDFSEATNMTYIFSSVNTVAVPEVSFVNVVSLEGAYGWSPKLEEIENIILREDGTNTFVSTFKTSKALKKVKFTGVIGNDIDFASCPLEKASFESVVSALSETTTGKTVTFKESAKTAAFTDEEWAALIATKPNWTFSLV